jgi:hypothetical protein
MRRKFVYDPETKDLVEVTAGRPSQVDAPAVWGDIKPFVSPATGEYISDRGQLRRHMKANGIAFADEMKGTAERVRAEKARREAAERKRALIDAYEHTRNQERAKSRYG